MKNILLLAAIALSANFSFGQILVPIVPSTPERGEFSLIIQGLRTGTPIHPDEQFDSTNNGIVVYNGTGNGNVSIQRVAAPRLPNTSGYCLEITHTGPASPFLGGFYQSVLSGPNKTFVHLFRAKAPSGYRFAITSNVLGTGMATKWLTSYNGTGKWEDYGVVLACGNTAPFGTGGYVLLVGDTPTVASPLVWHLASSAVYDLTDLKHRSLQNLQSADQAISVGTAGRNYPADNTGSNADLSNTLEALAKKSEELIQYILELTNEMESSKMERK